MSNTGKPSEKEFERILALLGKAAFLHRITDSAEIHSIAGKGGNRKAPSDYLLTLRGELHYAEVKSTEKDVFKKSAIRPGQLATARMNYAAGGSYWFYIHFIPIGRWFRVPAFFFIESTKGSFSPLDLIAYKWTDA